MVNNLTFMGFTALFGFMLVYGMAVAEHNHIPEVRKKVSVGAFIDKKVAEFDDEKSKVHYTNNEEKLAYLWGNNDGK